MLEILRRLLHERGALSQAIIDETVSVPHRNSYVKRFGSLMNIYQLLGYRPDFYQKMSPRPRGMSNEDMLDALRKLLRERGLLSQSVIDDCKSVPSYHQYYCRFGSLARAYELIGYTPESQRRALRTKAFAPKRPRRPRGLSDAEMLDALRALWRERGRLSQSIIDESRTVPSCNLYAARFGSLSRAYELIGYRLKWPSQSRGQSNIEP
jgi:hypothetical protein